MAASKRNSKRQGMNWIKKIRRIRIYWRDDFTCAYCRRNWWIHRFTISLDHLIPDSEGGTHASDNLITTCMDCNRRRDTQDWRIFAGPEVAPLVLETVQRPLPDSRAVRQIVKTESWGDALIRVARQVIGEAHDQYATGD